jgi:hypothetical protein
MTELVSYLCSYSAAGYAQRTIMCAGNRYSAVHRLALLSIPSTAVTYKDHSAVGLRSSFAVFRRTFGFSCNPHVVSSHANTNKQASFMPQLWSYTDVIYAASRCVRQHHV